MTNKVCLVIGACDATGGAVAKRFAREGFAVCATRRTVEKIEPLIASIRSDGGMAYGLGSYARDEDQWQPHALFQTGASSMAEQGKLPNVIKSA